jgi:hypothetical protein
MEKQPETYRYDPANPLDGGTLGITIDLIDQALHAYYISISSLATTRVPNILSLTH